ncbi:MAG: prephenate dehydratase [Thermoguttaceae bacterium]
MNLTEIRHAIDQVDHQMLALLRQRMEYVLQAEKHKGDVQDVAREQSILAKVAAHPSPLLDQAFRRRLYELILAESKELQRKHLKLVGFGGEHGAWAEIAVQKFWSGMASIACEDFRDVFSCVENGELEFGLVPIENSIEGSVGEVNDLLVATSLKIVAEAVLPIHQSLLALPGVSLQEIRSVYSHEQALGQCRAFLTRHKIEGHRHASTAGAARWLAHEQQRSTGVIASESAAELYGLEVIQENIEDNPQNATRFVLLSKEPTTGPADKCTIAFATQHRVGALSDVVRIFADNKINLTRIESRPIRVNPGAFAFLLDFQGKPDDPAVLRALDETRKVTVSLKNLGFYSEADAPAGGPAA